jgi:hypothetical protein
LSYFKDSDVSVNSNENADQFQSTKIYFDDSTSISTISNLSYIPHDDVQQKPIFQCCRCQCHRLVNNNQLFDVANQQNQMRTEIYPFIL